MDTELSYIGIQIAGGRYTLTKRICYDETMTRALYKAVCAECHGGPLVWINLETGQWEFERSCRNNHKRDNQVREQRLARLTVEMAIRQQYKNNLAAINQRRKMQRAI